jgi:ATP phosphoribosyltransferase regulatory subunit
VRITAAFPTGVTALLFDEAERRRRFEEAAVASLRERGFSEVILPILDYFEPYQSLLTREARDELYRFVDRDGELLALRGDFTPMLARLLAPRVESLPLPLRLFYRGDRVRYQEERPGRLREYYEMGAELLGAPGEAADEEMLDLFLRVLQLRDGISVRLVVGFAGALDRLLLECPAENRAALLRAIARRDRRAARQAGSAVLRVVEDGAPERASDLGDEAAPRLERLRALIERVERRFDRERVAISIDLAEFAEDTLDAQLQGTTETAPYYDGLMFRAYADGMTPVGGDGGGVAPAGGGLTAGRGGRYDRLFRRLGADLSAVGFSVSPDRLLGSGAPSSAPTTMARRTW